MDSQQNNSYIAIILTRDSYGSNKWRKKREHKWEKNRWKTNKMSARTSKSTKHTIENEKKKGIGMKRTWEKKTMQRT